MGLLVIGQTEIEPAKLSGPLIKSVDGFLKLLVFIVGIMLVHHITDKTICPRRLNSKSSGITCPSNPHQYPFDRIKHNITSWD